MVGGHATVGRLSNNVFCTFQAIWKIFEKSHWTVTRQWSEVTRPSADCQTTFFGHFKQFGIFSKKVTERWRDSGRRSRDRRPTVKQRFLYVSSNLKIFRKKSLNGHATVVGGHATVGRLSNNVFLDVSSNLEIFWIKVTERSRDSGRRSRDRRLTVKHIYAWIRERERERETISVTLHTGTAMLCRWPFHQPASRLRLALTRVIDRQGQLVYEYCKSSHWQVEFMLCAICRSTFTRQFSRVLTPGPSSLDFSRESPAKDMWCYVAYVYNGELVSLIGNEWVGIFPPKSKIIFVLSLALKWCQNFQDGTIPVGGDTWTSCLAERKEE